VVLRGARWRTAVHVPRVPEECGGALAAVHRAWRRTPLHAARVHQVGTRAHVTVRVARGRPPLRLRGTPLLLSQMMMRVWGCERSSRGRFVGTKRDFTHPDCSPNPQATHTPRKCGRCPSSKAHFHVAPRMTETDDGGVRAAAAAGVSEERGGAHGLVHRARRRQAL
jgi:hypothetical protein